RQQIGQRVDDLVVLTEARGHLSPALDRGGQVAEAIARDRRDLDEVGADLMRRGRALDAPPEKLDHLPPALAAYQQLARRGQRLGVARIAREARPPGGQRAVDVTALE